MDSNFGNSIEVGLQIWRAERVGSVCEPTAVHAAMNNGVTPLSLFLYYPVGLYRVGLTR